MTKWRKRMTNDEQLEQGIAELTQQKHQELTASNGERTGAEHIGAHALAIIGRARSTVVAKLHDLRQQIDDLERALIEDGRHVETVVTGHMAMGDQAGRAAAVIAGALDEMRAARATLVGKG
jgi:hypothetical protein